MQDRPPFQQPHRVLYWVMVDAQSASDADSMLDTFFCTIYRFHAAPKRSMAHVTGMMGMNLEGPSRYTFCAEMGTRVVRIKWWARTDRGGSKGPSVSYTKVAYHAALLNLQVIPRESIESPSSDPAPSEWKMGRDLFDARTVAAALSQASLPPHDKPPKPTNIPLNVGKLSAYWSAVYMLHMKMRAWAHARGMFLTDQTMIDSQTIALKGFIDQYHARSRKRSAPLPVGPASSRTKKRIKRRFGGFGMRRKKTT